MEEGGRRTVRAGKDKPAALAYQLLDETLLLISTHSNDKCDQLRQRLINSRRGGGGITGVRLQILHCLLDEQVLRRRCRASYTSDGVLSLHFLSTCFSVHLIALCALFCVGDLLGQVCLCSRKRIWYCCWCLYVT